MSSEQANTLTQAKRIIAWVIRFICAIRCRIQRRSLSASPAAEPEEPNISFRKMLSGNELREARIAIIRYHQSIYCSLVVLSRLSHLNVKADHEGILRCYGRFGKANLSQSAKNTILVMQKTLLAELIICECHGKGHPGVNHTISLIRQEYWVPKIRAQVTKQVRQCIVCQKFNNLPYRYPL